MNVGTTFMIAQVMRWILGSMYRMASFEFLMNARYCGMVGYMGRGLGGR
jgi:hypothetical protein